ncbi:MAG: EAL domain-containing protein [Acidimicrobiales bacterium]|jgi:diguanylate cyclase (GGDEF)-like protein
MSIDVPEAKSETGNGRTVSGPVVHVLLAMVRAHGGESGVAQTLALAGEERPFSELGDTTRWSTLAQAVALLDAAALATGDSAIGLHVGEALLFMPEDQDQADRLRALGSTGEALRHFEPLVERVERTSKAAVVEVATDHALIEMVPRGAEGRHAHLCEMTRGLLSQVPVLFGLDPAIVTETECSARGGRRCLYAVSWEEGGPDHDHAPAPAVDRDPASVPTVDAGAAPDGPVGGEPDPADPAVELREQLDRMSLLVGGAFATSLDLPYDNVDAVLADVAARADAVVSCHRFLLMVRVGTESPIQIHYRGLENDEAQRLAVDLWSGRPDVGSLIVVDIVSGRARYGRLVAFPPPDSSSSEEESQLLALFAEHAATALDIFTVLTEAERSNATARTLLSFFESLSRVTTLGELVQLVADTVPAVTGCDQSTVYLWEAESGQLVPRARTAGMEDPSAYQGPIVPVSGPGLPGAGFGTFGPDPGTTEPLSVRTDIDVIGRMMSGREVMVLDSSTDDPFLRNLLDRSATAASVIAPLFAAGEFLGVIAANFGELTPTASIHDPGLHERLSGLADQASTSVQNLDLLEKVSHMAWHDALTGLPNRRLFEDRVQQELVRSRRVGEPVCMFFVDLDHFKTVNDTMGHAAGDDLIRQVSQRLVDTVRQQDTVARVGGDEFAILLPGLADQLSIDQLARRSLEALSTPFLVRDEEVETSASIGIAMAPEHGDTYDELLSRADEAMYRAKDRGRNAFQMYAGSLVTARGRLAVSEEDLYSDLVHALDHEEFFLVYQPYVDLRTSEVVGVEALVRWNHPNLGVLEPSSFISMAERSNIIVALDTWVLEQTCRQGRAWRDAGLPPLRLSVNLASRDLSNPQLFVNIHRTLLETGIDPWLLELDITERVVPDHSEPARDTIERLRRLGVRFTIDDFGTGNSSLDRIGAFPVSTLKIDQSFVQVLGPDAENNSLVSAIISMAARLGMDCVAEGVETSVQNRVLLQRGCTTAQGYFFSPPLPASDIEVMMVDIANGDGTLTFGDVSD